jgi:hypothetical protein
MFRIVARNENDGHPDSAPFAVGTLADDLDAANTRAADVRKEYPKRDGYIVTVEELVQDGDTAKWEER